MKLKGFLGKSKKFFREVKAEMKKVTWPGRKEVVSNTFIVIVSVAIAAVVIGFFDAAVVGALKSIIGN